MVVPIFAEQEAPRDGVGALATYSLAEARDLAKICRQSMNQGVDPIDARKATRAKTVLDAAKSATFKMGANIAYRFAHER